jgi:4-hydroxybenzoate polyprenyltransferase
VRTLEMIRFSHTVFALPFALLALFLASGGWPEPRILGWVLVALVAARSAAMGTNRIADRRFDARNPRTAGRHLVVGTLSLRYAAGFTVVASLVFVLAAWRINPTALALSPLVLAVLLGYSFLKRFTWLAHLGVGVALGLSPLGAWIAGAGGFEGDLRVPVMLGLAVALWVAGFDLIYACQDAESDRVTGLRSIPARFGVGTALRVARAAHAGCVAGFVVVGATAGLGTIWYVAVGVAALLLVVEHSVVSADDLSRANLAFFTLNGIVALLLGAAGILDLVV